MREAAENTQLNKMTAACAQAGIPAWKYNMSLLGVLRTERTRGRGGSSYSTWKLEQAKADGEPVDLEAYVKQLTSWQQELA